MSDSTTPQVLGFYSSYRIPQICQEYSPHVFEKSRRSIRCTFRSTPPPCKFWASTSPTEFFKSVQNTPPLFLKKKQGEYSLDISSDSTPFQVLGSYSSCHSSIGLVDLKLGLRPSFILNEKLCLFPDFDDDPDGALDCSF